MYEAATAGADSDEARETAREQARVELYAPPAGHQRRTRARTPPSPHKRTQSGNTGRTRLRTPPPGFATGISLAHAKALMGASTAEDARLGTSR